jgi:hypothetical protein
LDISKKEAHQMIIPLGTTVTTMNNRTFRVGMSIECEKIALNVYRTSKGTMFTTAHRPGFQALERMCDNGVVKTPCGCKTEPDGTCPHGVPAWTLIMGVC